MQLPPLSGSLDALFIHHIEFSSVRLFIGCAPQRASISSTKFAAVFATACVDQFHESEVSRFAHTFVVACGVGLGVLRFENMAMRAAKLVGEHYAPALTAVRQFTASRSLLADGADPVRAPGSPGNVSAGVKDMDSGDREAVTEGSESLKDVAETMKEHDDAGKTDSAGDLKGKPVAEADKEMVREDIAGTPV